MCLEALAEVEQESGNALFRRGQAGDEALLLELAGVERSSLEQVALHPDQLLRREGGVEVGEIELAQGAVFQRHRGVAVVRFADVLDADDLPRQVETHHLGGFARLVADAGTRVDQVEVADGVAGGEEPLAAVDGVIADHHLVQRTAVGRLQSQYAGRVVERAVLADDDGDVSRRHDGAQGARSFSRQTVCWERRL